MAYTEDVIRGDAPSESEAYRRLFLAVAEELKLPLMHIARQAELECINPSDSPYGLRDIQETADMSLTLLDSYLLSLRLGMRTEAALALEPVSLSAALHETRQQLQATARQYGVELEVFVSGRYEPVLANREVLIHILVGLGYSLIEALPASGASSQRLRLAAHRTKDGLVAGVYGAIDSLTPRILRHGQALHGHVRQPMVAALPGSSAHVFVADAMSRAMHTHLRVGRFQKLPGFAITLSPSHQLQLV